MTVIRDADLTGSRSTASRSTAEPATPPPESTVGALRQAHQKLEATAMRLRAVEADRDSWRGKYRAAIRERDRDRARLDILLNSESYRLGLTIVMLVKSPIKTVLRLIRAIVRLIATCWTFVTRRPSPTTVAPPASAAPPPPQQPAAKANAKPQRPVLSDRMPVYAYVACGLDLDGLRSLARVVGQVALASGNHVPLIVTDQPDFSLLRDTGLAIEYVPDRQTWQRHRPELDWDQFYADRLGQLMRVHHPTRIYFVETTNVLTRQRLLALNTGHIR